MNRFCAALLPLCLSACLADRLVMRQEFVEYVKAKEQDDEQIARFVAHLACPPLIQETLGNIRSACKKADEATPGGVCTPDTLQNSIEKFQGMARRSFFADLIKLTHEVVYINRSDRDFDSTRKKRLKALFAIPLFKQTRYLLATSAKYSVADTERRIRLVTEYLTANGVPAERIEKPLTYNFFLGKYGIKPTDIRTEDQWIPDSTEPKDLDQAVWIIRSDCLPLP